MQRLHFGKQCKELGALARLRGVASIDGVDYGRLYDDVVELGKNAKVTVAEYRQYKIATGAFPAKFLPAGRTKREAKAIQNEFNRPARTAAELKRRQAKDDKAEQTFGGLNPRASAIYMALTKPKTISQIATGLRRHPAFLTSSGDRLDERSLKRTIQRLLDGALADRVDVTRTRHKNGWEMDMFRRR